MNSPDKSSINLKVAVDLYAEHRRLKALGTQQEQTGSDQAETFLIQAECIYKSLCILASHYGFQMDEVIEEYRKSTHYSRYEGHSAS